MTSQSDMPKKFTSLEQVAAYLAHDKITCLECGKDFTVLASHLKRCHGLSCDDYRQRWDLPAMTPLAGASYRQFHRDKAHRMQAEGILTYEHLAAATTKASKASKPKVGVAKKAHAELMASKRRQKPHLPPGGKKK